MSRRLCLLVCSRLWASVMVGVELLLLGPDPRIHEAAISRPSTQQSSCALLRSGPAHCHPLFPVHK